MGRSFANPRLRHPCIVTARYLGWRCPEHLIAGFPWLPVQRLPTNWFQTSDSIDAIGQREIETLIADAEVNVDEMSTELTVLDSQFLIDYPVHPDG